MEDYLMWTVNNQLTTDFLQLLSQICHIVLGLTPQTKEEEGKIIQQWLERENRKSLEVGQIWYLINMQWWNLWLDYVNAELDPGGHPLRSSVKGKHQQHSTLGWEDDAVVMTGMTKAGGDNHSLRLAGSNLTSHDLNPAHRSPSMSPKVSRKNGSWAGAVLQKPPAINNNPLLVNPSKYTSLTNEGGRLRRDITLVRGKDFEIVPECIWRALTSWYGESVVALPRTVINSVAHNNRPTLELYPICVKIIRHQIPSQRPPPTTTFTGMMAGIGGMAFNLTANPAQPRRYHAHTASFSRKHTMRQIYEFLGNKLRFYREDFRLWKINSKDDVRFFYIEGRDE
ncbi:ubiquitin carboxyl-terminal hydrolase 32 [Elysia marginata]|uniref:Ubiquitin carboxyl-terminal hydrolase 32 n=1 Tax=Elysia marginata TaxID=1093978 RepID=A0AAV4FDI1_9GAST|nr:ubiquitin carboxyl-terminal hydrolase 32 [Elysia marginata]